MPHSSPLESIFFAALEKRSRDERMAYLDEACANDAELRGSVERMLAAQAEAGSFLETPASGLGATPADTELFPRVSETPGTVIGPYKLLQQIGEGGMGVVFMAEQSEPLQRTVALKIIKPGMDSRQVIARFEAERQAVAMMDHPNIAKVLDAGTTDSGRPYFVMELVKGVPITKYCDEKHLPLPARLELFVQVCQAVQHAHQKGIIHRDIKPNNVLVAEYDNAAVPKVIDFGVAKATAQKLTERTMFTEFGQVLGTMEYMSPEQSKFNQLDVDTRSDVYSLGVLLYELLAGSTPFEGKRLHEAAFDEMLRIIREEEPPKPSTRLSSIDTLPSVAVNRHTEPVRLSKAVRGELDWIVMKALEKDRNRRYETASGFAADIERHLHDEPVEAGPPAAAYRLKKFIRRNKAGALAGAAIFAALLIGLILASLGFLQARRQAQIAAAEASKATAINDLLQQMLKSASPYAAKGSEYTVRQMLEDFSAKLDDQIQNQPEVEATIRATIGNALLELDYPDAAAPHLKRALEIRRRLFGEDHEDVASSYSDCAYIALYANKITEAEELLRKSLAIYDKMGVENAATTETLSSLGLSLAQQMRYREADAVFEKAEKLAREHGYEHERATILYRQSMLALATPEGAAKAEQLARQSLALHRQLHGSNHPNPAWVLMQLAYSLQEQNKLDEAEQCLRESIAIFRDLLGDEHFLVHRVRESLKLVLMTRGDQAALAALDAEQSAVETATLADYDKDFAIHPDSPYRLMQRGNFYALQGDFGKADADLARAAELAPESSYATFLRAVVCLARNDDAGFRQASKALADAAARGTDSYAAQAAAQVFILTPDSAIDADQALEFAQQTLEAGPQNGLSLGLLGCTLYRAGQYEKAAQSLKEAFDVYGKHHAKSGMHAYGHLFLAMTHHRLGHPEEATDWLNRAVQIIDARQGVVAYWPNSMLLERLRQEAEALLGVEREVVKQQATELPEQQAPTIQPQSLTAPKTLENQPPNPDD